jgi:hypothetical protein
VWSFDWIISDLRPDPTYFSAEAYPKVYSWRHRFKSVLHAAHERAPAPVRLQGADAVRAILTADFLDRAPTVDPADPQKLKEGATVLLYPTDGGGFTHKDKGRLVKLTKDEAAIVVRAKSGEEVRIHAPRWGFRIEEIGASEKL